MDQLAARYSRRRLLTSAAGCAGSTLVAWPAAAAETPEDQVRVAARLIGKTPILSNRVRLFMPKTFPSGYTVPLAFDVDSPMTTADHVTSVRVLAPRNPLVEVATFHFIPGRTQARISTRIRLAQPQYVLALAQMSDETILMSSAWVDVATDGCK